MSSSTWRLCSSASSHHPRVGFKRIDPAYSCRVVEGEVYARTYPDLEDPPLSKWNDSLADLPDGPRIAQQAHKMGIDTISVEGMGFPPRLVFSLDPA
jgi:hypothetical protein